MDRKSLIGELLQNFAYVRGHIMRSRVNAPGCKVKLPTRAQLGLLMIVGAGESYTLKQIATACGMSPSAVTQLVDSLVAQGHIRRQEDIDDRRKLSLILTPKGKKILEQAKKEKLAFLTEVFRPLTSEELEQLHTIQQKIIVHLQTL